MKTIKCQNIKEMIMEYIDGLLNKEDKDILFQHVSQCENCKNYLKDMEKIKLFVSKLRVKEPVYLESKIMAKINEYEKSLGENRVFVPQFILKPALSFAISALIIIGSIFIYNTTNEIKISFKDMPVKVKDNKETLAKPQIMDNISKQVKKTEEKVTVANNKIIQKPLAIIFDNTNENQINTKQYNYNYNNEEPKYLLSKTEDINLKMAKEVATPSTTNPLLEREKAIIGNNLINPLKGEYCTIKIKVDESARVRIIIYDKRIRVVANLIDEQKEPGVYEVKWYGRNNNGDILSEGVYFVYIQIGSNVIKKNIIIVK